LKNLIDFDMFGGVLGLLILFCIIVMIIAATKKKPVIIQLTLGIVFILLSSQLIIQVFAFAKYPISAFTLSVFAGVFLTMGIKTFHKAIKIHKAEEFIKYIFD